MEFWALEVKPGEPLKAEPKEDCLIHLSQAALEESKKDKGEPVMIFAKVGDQKIVLGTLSSDKFPQISFDVVFDKEFELSHNSKNGSVHFCGYQSQIPGDDVDEYPESEDEDVLLVNADNAKLEIPKPAAANAKPKANVEPAKASKEEPEDSDDEDDSDDDEEDGSGDSDGAESMSEDDEDADSESDDEETPKKVESANKRPAVDSATKTPAPSKKQKADGKKNVHTATPHPAKKPSANGSKQTSKSGGQFSCKSCDRSFVSDFALQSHSKAKHDK